MNNLKKVGLSALAGSLVAFSANAGEMTVSGSASLSMSSSNELNKRLGLLQITLILLVLVN